MYWQMSNPSRETHGQLAKMVATAAELSSPAGTRTFEDVPDTSPFYLWIQQLANTGAIGVYPCRGTNPSTGQAASMQIGKVDPPQLRTDVDEQDVQARGRDAASGPLLGHKREEARGSSAYTCSLLSLHSMFSCLLFVPNLCQKEK